MRVCVTGASGKAGRAVVAELLAAGHEVTAVDLQAPKSPLAVQVMLVDLVEYGQAVEALAGCDAVIHMANIPAPGLFAPAVIFQRNSVMNANVFFAAALHKLKRVVWASSETTLGLDFTEPPKYAPLDEDHYPYPTTTYSLSKVVSETAATHVAAWSGIPFVALRISNIMEPHDYAAFPSWQNDPRLRKWNLWSYVDARDVAQASRLGLEAAVTGASSYIVAAADTVMERPSAELMAEVFPGVRLTRELEGRESLMSIDKARRVLGYQPRFTWTDFV
jgi:nucleoside-diphosphate-sugar epimerase